MRGWALLPLLPLAACGNGAKPQVLSAPVASVSVTPGVAVDRADADASRRRVLAALDDGDLPAATSELASIAGKGGSATALAAVVRAYGPPEARRSRLLANVTPVRVAAIPPAPARNPNESKLSATRTTSPPGLGELHAARDGRAFPDRPSPEQEQALPSWLPPRLADKPLHRLRASDGRWVALWADRYVAIVGESTTLLDFGGWSTLAVQVPTFVEWADVAGDILYVVARTGMGDRFVVAIGSRTGKPLWRSENGGFADGLVVANDRIVGWRYGSGKGKPGELVTMRRDTGVTVARRATPEIDSGECQLVPAFGLVHCIASSSLYGGTGLKSGESLEIHEPAPTLLPAPAEPSNAPTLPIAKLPAAAPNDARVVAWKLLDRGDPRAAILALRPVLVERPTDIAALALDETARAALETAREVAAKELVAKHPPVVAGEAPSGNAPIARPRSRRLVVMSRKSITLDQMPSEFPDPDDDWAFPPAWVPETLGSRRRNVDASAIVAPNQRVDIYWGYGSPALSVSFRDGAVTAVLEHPREVRASGASGDVLLTVAGHGRFFLEAHDGRTARLYYRSKEELHDQYFVVESGYVVASTPARPSAELVLIEADTGKVVARVHEPPPQDPYLVFRRGSSIMAVNMRSSLTLALE